MPCDRALAGPCGPVDGNDHQVVGARSESRRSKKPGKLTAATSAPSTSTPSRETRPATAPSIAILWSPRASTEPPREPGRHAADGEAVRRRADVGAEPSQPVDDGLDPVGLLRAQLGRAAEDAVAVRVHREEREERQLVDEQRHLPRSDRRRDELGRPDVEVAGRLAADPPPVEDGDVGAHPLEHVEQAGAPRVQVDAVHGQLRAGEQRRGDEERRRRGEVAGDLDVAELEPLDRLNAHALRLAANAARRACASMFSVWSRVGRGSSTVVSPPSA